MFEEIFKFKKPDPERLADFGFARTDGGFVFRRDIMGGEFRLAVTVTDNGGVDTALTENATGEEYTLYKTNAQGGFLGEVRTNIAAVLEEVAGNCFVTSAFKSPQTEAFLKYAREKYGDEPEFLWERSPDCAVLRRKDSRKWYAIIMTVPKNRFGIDSAEPAEVVNMQIAPGDMEQLLRRKGIYPGWHMNKKYWYSVILDGTVPDAELRTLADISYDISGRKK